MVIPDPRWHQLPWLQYHRIEDNPADMFVPLPVLFLAVSRTVANEWISKRATGAHHRERRAKLFFGSSTGGTAQNLARWGDWDAVSWLNDLGWVIRVQTE